MGPTLGRDAEHPGVLDPDLLDEQRDLAAQSIVLGLQPDAGVEVILGVTRVTVNTTFDIEIAWTTAERTAWLNASRLGYTRVSAWVIDGVAP